MKNQSLKVIYSILFTLFVGAYIYSFAGLLGLYLVNVVVGVVGTVIYPILTGLLFYLSFKWIGNSHEDESVTPYLSTISYARVWSLVFEWVLILVTTFTVSGAFPQEWMGALLWILVAIFSYFIYPKYLDSVFEKGIAEDEWQSDLKTKFSYFAYGVFGLAIVLGVGRLLISGIASLI